MAVETRAGLVGAKLRFGCRTGSNAWFSFSQRPQSVTPLSVPEGSETILNLRFILPRSRANGPGLRTAIWFQGCSLGCPGCFNPGTHSHEAVIVMPVDKMVANILTYHHAIEGISVSGGEPLEQPRGLYRLLERIRSQTDLSVLLFSGFTLDEISENSAAEGILDNVDVLVAGRYERDLPLPDGLRGSANQSIHLLTDRYRLDEVEKTPHAEILIDSSGHISVSGVNPPNSRTEPGQRDKANNAWRRHSLRPSENKDRR